LQQIKATLVAVLTVGEVLANCQHFCHLIETQVQLIHFSIAFFESFKQVVDLEANLFVLLVGPSVFLQPLHRLYVKYDFVCQLHDRLSYLKRQPPYDDPHATNKHEHG